RDDGIDGQRAQFLEGIGRAPRVARVVLHRYGRRWKSHPFDQAAEETELLAHAAAARYDFARDDTEIAGLPVVFEIGEIAEDPEDPPGSGPFRRPVRGFPPRGAHGVVAFALFRIEPRYPLGSLLEVPVHPPAPAPVAVVHPRRDAIVLAEVAA